MFGAIKQRLSGVDDAVVRHAREKSEAARRAKIADIMGQIRSGGADDTAKWIGSARGMSTQQVEDLAAKLGTRAGRNEAAREHGPQMPRGFDGLPMGGLHFGKQKMGPMEYIHGITAANPTVRRVGIGSAAAGGGVAMTAAGQQLLALMGFMNQETDQAQRTAQSPLA